ncbi:hypothetical protein BT69DRAFT_1280383 [Atractiella rhizophila]|nr:hypothetical protein BT69DRAFT_1287008 [Atractiella rhizophila]KAH8924679.1 hypothetical protein BT69DRAFT_1280383 [Atractiella rhizophila]
MYLVVVALSSHSLSHHTRTTTYKESAYATPWLRHHSFVPLDSSGSPPTDSTTH